MDYAYIRVAPDNTSENEQLAELGLPPEQRFVDRCSYGETDRPELKRLLEMLQAGDIVHVQSLDRLSRTIQQLQSLVDTVLERGAQLRFHKENITFTANPSEANIAPIELLRAFAAWETSLTAELSQTHQKVAGRPSSLPAKQREMVLAALRGNINCNVAHLSAETGVSIHTCYYFKKMVKNELQSQGK